ncbi:octanoyltransferase [Polymorphobacter glacialis]|uniref:Octanoyltransferase n=1 Tax=Sandarakinorhabdus glacialis TaxID=1614636 RepID=A0A917ECK8_9SPHN|nr:lipoyl(octanoyl) transferase LipB [Polymorphobacter glacialis]GGE19504.1 octanoyltransferase [Polymorphobacter glacialis]
MEVPEWRVEPGLLDYPAAVAAMEARAAAIREGTAQELIWLVEHPPLYTAGTSAVAGDLLMPDRFPVYAVGRGGKHTYHGPGQRVVYVLLDLDRRGRDIRRFVGALEGWIIAALGDFGVSARTIDGKVGVWTGDSPAKIAAIGVRVRRWVSFYGVSVNVAPDLSHFQGILPCGLADPVTSLAEINGENRLSALDLALRRHLLGMLDAVGTLQARNSTLPLKNVASMNGA